MPIARIENSEKLVFAEERAIMNTTPALFLMIFLENLTRHLERQ